MSSEFIHDPSGLIVFEEPTQVRVNTGGPTSTVSVSVLPYSRWNGEVDRPVDLGASEDADEHPALAVWAGPDTYLIPGNADFTRLELADLDADAIRDLQEGTEAREMTPDAGGSRVSQSGSNQIPRDAPDRLRDLLSQGPDVTVDIVPDPDGQIDIHSETVEFESMSPADHDDADLVATGTVRVTTPQVGVEGNHEKEDTRHAWVKVHATAGDDLDKYELTNIVVEIV